MIENLKNILGIIWRKQIINILWNNEVSFHDCLLNTCIV